MIFKVTCTKLKLKLSSKMRVAFKYKFLVPFTLGLSCLLFCSDIIPDNSHAVTRTTVISNCSDYPDVAFIAFIKEINGGGATFYEISDDMSLYKGYKFNTLTIFGINRDTLESVGGIDQLTEEYVLSKVTPQRILCSSTFYVDDRSMYSNDEVYYSIENENGKYLARIKKRVVGFSDGSSEVVNY